MLLDLVSSTLASSARFWQGTAASRTTRQPELTIALYDREGCSNCRLVREALTALNLNVLIMPCPKGGKRFADKLAGHQPPLLIDLNTETTLTGPERIIEYLYAEYLDEKPPLPVRVTPLNHISSTLASTLRLNAGTRCRPSQAPEQPLTLYSFESSPYSRPVRERLCELEIPYHLINLGKQQIADLGPAKCHFSLGAYKPLPNTKRSQFFDEHGNVQVPYLVDPNTDTEMFESREIIAYLNNTYAIRR
ncbi:glutathione S-transferase N-terminal domain-containing protein [Kistimonas scapharcae]|uniref:Glutathione S-transferase N-terminal domain-containing protein n=1 Tax=Kistimonas scapharcae TaxID=1036133 RepID=A0ABP8VAE8_9GAMM